MTTAEDNGPSGLRFLLPNTIFSSHTVVLLISLLCAHVVASTVYYLTWHPLAGVPGPKLCAISRIPYWISYIKGNDVRWIHQLHTQYGPVLRFGPTDLSYTTAQAWKEIHGHGKGRGHDNEKAQEFSVQPVNGNVRQPFSGLKR